MRNAPFPLRLRAVSAALVLAALSLPPAAPAENAPRVDALQVAKLATSYLATHGRSAPYIVSILLEKDAIFSGGSSWVVRWSQPILADGNREIGMRVKLDGTVSYIVEDKSVSKKRASRRF